MTALVVQVIHGPRWAPWIRLVALVVVVGVVVRFSPAYLPSGSVIRCLAP